MKGYPIKELNAGLQALYDEINKDEMLRFSIDLSIITFGGEGDRQVNVIRDFSTLINDTEAPTLTANGCAFMEKAVPFALDMLKKEKLFTKRMASIIFNRG